MLAALSMPMPGMVAFPGAAENQGTNFEVIFLRICSLSWDDFQAGSLIFVDKASSSWPWSNCCPMTPGRFGSSAGLLALA